MISLLDKIKTWLANKPEEAYPLNDEPDIGSDAPDTDEDTAKEMPDKQEETTTSCTLFKIKF